MSQSTQTGLPPVRTITYIGGIVNTPFGWYKWYPGFRLDVAVKEKWPAVMQALAGGNLPVYEQVDWSWWMSLTDAEKRAYVDAGLVPEEYFWPSWDYPTDWQLYMAGEDEWRGYWKRIRGLLDVETPSGEVKREAALLNLSSAPIVAQPSSSLIEKVRSLRQRIHALNQNKADLPLSFKLR